MVLIDTPRTVRDVESLGLGEHVVNMFGPTTFAVRWANSYGHPLPEKDKATLVARMGLRLKQEDDAADWESVLEGGAKNFVNSWREQLQASEDDDALARSDAARQPFAKKTDGAMDKVQGARKSGLEGGSNGKPSRSQRQVVYSEDAEVWERDDWSDVDDVDESAGSPAFYPPPAPQHEYRVSHGTPPSSPVSMLRSEARVSRWSPEAARGGAAFTGDYGGGGAHDLHALLPAQRLPMPEPYQQTTPMFRATAAMGTIMRPTAHVVRPPPEYGAFPPGFEPVGGQPPRSGVPMLPPGALMSGPAHHAFGPPPAAVVTALPPPPQHPPFMSTSLRQPQPQQPQQQQPPQQQPSVQAPAAYPPPLPRHPPLPPARDPQPPPPLPPSPPPPVPDDEPPPPLPPAPPPPQPRSSSSLLLDECMELSDFDDLPPLPDGPAPGWDAPLAGGFG